MEQNTVLLVRKAKRGDVDAFALLYQEIYKDLYRFAFYTLKNPVDAQDVVSDTVTDAFAAIHRLRTEDAFFGWIFRILSNKCQQRLRDYARHPIELSEALAEQLPAFEGELDTAEHMQIRMLFGQLEATDRIIIALHVFAGYTSKEIAKHLHMNENTVRSREHRAFKKLKENLN